MSRIEGKKILITGASRGLGAVCARAFSGMGAELALFARSKELLETVAHSCEQSDRHMVVAVDLLDTQAIAGSVNEVTTFLGQIDVVLHVAGGGLGLREPLLEAADLVKLLTLNVVAAAEINRLVVPDMLKRSQGNLVHVGSIAGREAVASVGYNTAKTALSAYVRSLGNELARSSLVVTGIQPGGFLAPGNSWERLSADKPDVVGQFIKQRLPRGHLAQADELVPLLTFLCSAAASMMAGCMVPIDAGEGKYY
ncbi:MAG: SDR family oxidoreductase [Desulfuromonadales bacterium]